jgi:alpha-beta hydrolase superfamily lysophospholipase
MTATRSTPLITDSDDSVGQWNNPETVAPRGTLIVIPGRGENPSTYNRFGTRVAFDGYRVRAVGDPTVDAAGVRQQVTALLADDTLPAPRVLVGSDSGALFAAGLAAAGNLPIDAVVLAGLLVSEQAIAPSTNWEDELGERTGCPTHRARLTDDITLRRGALATPPPAQWLATADLADVAVPVLGLHGAADTISPLDAVRAHYARAPKAELVSIADGRHDALNDLTHRTAAATVVLFLERLRLDPSLAPIARIEG